MRNFTIFKYLVAVLLGTGLLGLRPGQAWAQTYQLPVSGSTSYTTCAGTLYDDGGANGNYSAGAYGAVTLLPGTTGSKIKLEFTSFNVETSYDKVYVYDGTSTSAPLIGTYDSSNPPGTLYGSTASGALTVLLTADNIIQLSGFAATISCVTTIPQPDLTVQSATISPTSAVAGNTISASSLVYNLSGTTATSSNLGYYLSTDNVLSSNDLLLGSATGTALSVGQSSSRYSSLTIPATTTAGTYYVLFIADYQNQVAESNEYNNGAAVAITVQAAATDLIIQSSSVSPTVVAAGSAVSFSSYIYNQGNSAAASSSVGFYLSTNTTLDANDQLLTSQYGSALGAGVSSTRTGTAAIPASTTAGSYYVLFVADYQNQVTEANKTNNVSAVSLTVLPPGPDLTVTSQSLYSSSVVAGSAVTASAYVYNQGNQTASSSDLGLYLSTNTTFDASDVQLALSTGASLAAGGSSSRSSALTIPAATAAGTYYVLFVADPSGNVTESNESNNVVYATLTVYAPSVDLTIYSPSVSPTSATPGSSVSAGCYLYNQGTTAASSAAVGFYLSTNSTLDASDVLIGNTSGTYVGASNSYYVNGTATVPTGTAPGTYYVLFVADYLNQVTETNKSNNLNYTTLQVTTPFIDLTISSAYVNPTQVISGGSVTASCYLYNQGSLTANSATVGYYLSTNTTLDANDVLLGNSPGVTLTSGNSSSRSSTLTIPSGTASGTYYVLFVADYLNQITESNESNNLSYTTLQVVAPYVDLTVYYTPTVSQSSVAAGGSVSIGSYVYNLGNIQVSPVAVGYYLSTNSTLDASDVLVGSTSGTSVAAGSYAYVNGTVTVPTSTASGTYYVLFVVDYLNQISESNENNNLSYTTLQVVAPYVDLSIYYTPTVAQSSVASGGSVSVGSYLSNFGNTPVSSAAVGYYLSTNATLDASDVLIGNTSGTSVGINAYTYVNGTATVPASTASGTYYVLFVADYLNQITESNESNNVNYTTIQVVAPYVDLTTQFPNIVQSQVAIGNVLNVSCSFSNQGNQAATPATVGYYLSADNTLSANDILIGNATYSTLAAATSITATSSPVVPATTPAGTYYVLFVADYLGQVAESNENNNVSAYYSTIQVTTPDLTIQNAALSVSSVNTGGSLNSTCSIVNKGNSVANSSTVGYYLSTNTTFDASDVALTTTTYSSGALNANSSSPRNISLTVPAGTSGGNYYVLFVADPLNQVTESDRTNNVTALALTVVGPYAGTVVPTTGSATLTSCSEKVADSGGNYNYASNSDGVLVIRPATAGMVSRLTFTAFSTEQNADILYVYDGTSTSAPLLGQYSGTTLPAAITATNASGALTLRFKSDASNESTGFEATVSCVMILAAREQTAGYDVSVVPNPVAGAAPLRVQLSGLGASCAATLTLRNSLGQLVATQPFALAPGRLNQAQVATAGLATGVYILQLTGTDLNVVRRVVVE